MHDYMLEEMADAIAKELHVDHNDLLRSLHRYWQDKIAHVWTADNMLNAALNAGKPITRADAIELLHAIFEDHDSDEGIRWNTLELELQEYHLNLKRIPEDQYNEVHGVFRIWRPGDLRSHQFGIFPDRVQGNLSKALDFAKSLADETPGVAILIGCEPRHSDQIEAWLSVTRVEENVLIEEKEQPCMPYRRDNASAS